MADFATDWTPYRFGFNNPVRVVDPSGLYEQQLQGQDGDWWTVDCENGEGSASKYLIAPKT